MGDNVARFIFVRWLDPQRLWAVIKVSDRLTYYMYVPRTRLIPHPACELEARSKGITDPNDIVDYCAERSSLFGIPLMRHFAHLYLTKKDLYCMDSEEQRKAYLFPSTVDFSCVRDCILERKGDVDECIRLCS